MLPVSDNLRFLRDRKGIKQVDIADELGIARGTYASYENGITPKLDTLIKIAEYYNVSLDYLVGRSSDPRPVGNEFAQIINKVSAANPAFPASTDFLALSKAAARYNRSGKPCTDLPLTALTEIVNELTAALNAAASGDYPALFDASNAAGCAALKILSMATIYLERKYDE